MKSFFFFDNDWSMGTQKRRMEMHIRARHSQKWSASRESSYRSALPAT
jgi:hypothetical protein